MNYDLPHYAAAHILNWVRRYISGRMHRIFAKLALARRRWARTRNFHVEQNLAMAAERDIFGPQGPSVVALTQEHLPSAPHPLTGLYSGEEQTRLSSRLGTMYQCPSASICDLFDSLNITDNCSDNTDE